MPPSPEAHRSSIIPALRYQDAAGAIEWLSKAFGLEKQACYPNPDGTIGHAQLTFAGGMIMLGSASNPNPYSEFMRVPAQIGNVSTQTIYVVVNDCDALYARAKAAGAEILMDIEDKDYGGRGFSCRDLEGHIWSFGSYNPWH